MTFLRCVVFLALCLAVNSAIAAKQPNIVFIFSDDHAYQAISAYGDARRLVETPHIDRIAKEGVRFDRCIVPNSICGPSRAMVLTGKHSHANGFYNNSNSRFDGSQTTFPKLLQGVGYQTALIGKWHLESDPTGFDFWQILPGQGIYYNPQFIRMGERITVEGYVTDLIADRSIEWLKNRDKTKPFLLMSQHKAPHREWCPPLRYLGWNKDKPFAEPETLFDDYANRGLAVRDHDMGIEKTMTEKDVKLIAPPQLTTEQARVWSAYYDPRNAKYHAEKPQGKDLVRWRYQRYMHDYLACVKAVDDAVGRMLAYLDDEGLSENTIVVYAADQGFYLGEHGWFDKRWIFEESARTPMVVRWPGVAKAGAVNGSLTSVIDFAPTFLEAAGVPIPAEIQGRSLRPLLAGSTPADWRKAMYYHYYEYPRPHHVRPHEGIITDRYKLVRFYLPDVDYVELYDREKDPHELRDFSRDPSYAATVAELTKQLAQLRIDLKVPDPIPKGAYGGLYKSELRPKNRKPQTPR